MRSVDQICQPLSPAAPRTPLVQCWSPLANVLTGSIAYIVPLVCSYCSPMCPERPSPHPPLVQCCFPAMRFFLPGYETHAKNMIETCMTSSPAFVKSKRTSIRPNIELGGGLGGGAGCSKIQNLTDWLDGSSRYRCDSRSLAS